MFKHDIKVGETVKIGDAVITIAAKSGQICTLLIDAPRSIVIETERDRQKKQEAPAPQQPA